MINSNKVDWQEISSFDKPDNSPGFLLWRTSCKWRREIESILRNFDITHPQYTILSYLAWLTKDGAKISQVEIAKHTNIDVATTSQIIRHLERKKLIKRKQMKGNDKAKYPFLTPDGISLIARTMPAVEFVDKAFFTPILNEKPSFIMKLTLLATSNN